ncbi:unnamed protein product [Gordionus sp. m RMFG-2023]|uniref:JNK-interacting protein 3-like isoform X2 n=1 Tax=Gordionus sp. m RMFG-2023 TaxID=3053472 RepID=UPI0030E293A6
MDEEHISDDNHMVVSDRVQSMARGIYQEFERMIRKYDEEVVKSLMPLVVSLLENLETTHLQAEETKIELEILKEDNDQLMTQYEREKQSKRSIEQKYFELDDVLEGEKKNLQDRIKSLESLVHIMELKSKNSMDHANRLEEKESEWKKDYNKLHERYSELFKTHLDYKERTKIMAKLNANNQNAYHNTAPFSSSNNISEFNRAAFESSDYDRAQEFSLDNDELSNRIWKDRISESEPYIEDNIQDSTNALIKDSGYSAADNLSLYDAQYDENSSASDHIFAMGKEVENLIEENNELLATKNALNIVKDDLIIKLDELTSEQEILREEIESLQRIKDNFMRRIDELENELKIMKSSAQAISKPENVDDSDEARSQNKRFTRLEMARVILERNEYKEKWLELRDAVRWTETIKAARSEKFANRSAPTNKTRGRSGSAKRMNEASEKSGGRVGTIWGFFSQLFGAPQQENFIDSNMINAENKMATIKYNACNERVSPGVKSILPDRDLLSEKLRAERHKRDKLNTFSRVQVSLSDNESDGLNHFYPSQEDKNNKKGNDENRRFQAYGWSLPVSQSRFIFPNRIDPTKHSSNVMQTKKLTSISIPVPIYCRPLSSERSQLNGCKISCASGVNLSGGRTKDGGKICGASVFYNIYNPLNETQSADKLTNPQNTAENNDYLTELEKELQANMAASRDLSASISASTSSNYSSLIWICTTYYSPDQMDTTLDITTPDTLEQRVRHLPTTNGTNFAGDTNVNESSPQFSDNANRFANQTQPMIFVLDATDPSNVLDYFCLNLQNFSRKTETSNNNNNKCDHDCQSILCIASVPGVSENEYLDLKNNDKDYFGETKLSEDAKSDRNVSGGNLSMVVINQNTNVNISNDPQNQDKHFYRQRENNDDDEIISSPLEEADKMNTLLPTMWIGFQNGLISIHSSISEWNKPLKIIPLQNSVFSILHFCGKVYAGLANATIAVFERNLEGHWDTSRYMELNLDPQFTGSIKCIISVCDRYIWACRLNTIHVIDPSTLKILREFSCDVRDENHASSMVWCGGVGVWVTLRMNACLSLFHALTCSLLTRIDLQTFLLDTISEKETSCAFSHFDRITTLSVSCHRLWVGTAKGTIVSIPFSQPANTPSIIPNSAHSVTVDSMTSSIFPENNFVPYCKLADAQFSFHGHKEAVKFLITVPCADTEDSKASSAPSSHHYLIVSGGEGYVDYRNDNAESNENSFIGTEVRANDSFKNASESPKQESNIDPLHSQTDDSKLENFIQTNLNHSYMHDSGHRKMWTQNRLPRSRSLYPLGRKETPHLIVWRMDDI